MLLLDTHLLLWAAFEPAKLSPKAVKTLRSRDIPLAFSIQPGQPLGAGHQDIAGPA